LKENDVGSLATIFGVFSIKFRKKPNFNFFQVSQTKTIEVKSSQEKEWRGKQTNCKYFPSPNFFLSGPMFQSLTEKKWWNLLI